MLRISGGDWKGQKLRVPPGVDTRPTSSFLRESIFNTLYNGMGLTPMRVLDLFAGSGALGLEALSHGANTAVFLESAPQAIKCLEQNLEMASDKSVSVLREADLKKWPKLISTYTREPFDLVFCDPPYGKGLIEKTFRALNSPLLWDEKVLLVAEMSSRETFVLEGWKALKERNHGDSKVVFYERLK